MAAPPSDQLPTPSPSNPSPNSNPNNLSNQKPNLNSLNPVPGSTNSASRVFPSPPIPPPPSSPIAPPPKAATAQQLLPRIQESLAAHGAVCPSLSSSSRVARSSADQVVTVVNPAFFNGNPAVVGVHQVHRFAPSFMAAAAAAVAGPAVRVLRSPPSQQRPVVPVRTVPKHAGVSGPPRIGAPVAHNKVTPFSDVPSPSDLNNYKDMREKNGENAVTVVINDRKVRLVDGAPSSLYALCRSWVRNDMPQEIQVCSKVLLDQLIHC
ncbi:hypothetical protein EJ110_NYTH14741 [Nymphaea thermarum]|nr:hypothetical protein EJ110_NYTH14741 [Nymphaea thermarum]